MTVVSVSTVCIFMYSCCFWPLSLLVSPNRAAVYQWCAWTHWSWGPPDPWGHSHPLWSHHPRCTDQNPLQHPQLAGHCTECNRSVWKLFLFLFERVPGVVVDSPHLSALCLSGNPLSLMDLVPLLQKSLKDESSVTCKMACSAVRVRICCIWGEG